MNGGYKIIDFKKVALSSTRVAIEEIMEDLTENNGKVVLLTNVVIGETEMDDCFSTVIVKSDQSIKLNCYDGYISINTSGAKYTSASVENLTESIGDLDDLETTEKDSLVGAINEVNSGLVKKTTATVSLTSGEQSGSATNLFGIPDGSIVLALYVERGELGVARSYKLGMYGNAGYTLTVYESGNLTTAASASVTVVYI